MHAKDDAVGVQRVVHGKSLPQELRVPGHLDVDAFGREAPCPLCQVSGGADGDGGLADDHGGPAQPRHQRVDHGVHVAQVGAVVALLLRGSDTEEVHVGEVRGVLVVGGEPQAARGEIVVEHLPQTRFVERDVAGGQLGHLAGVDVDAHDLVTELGHTRGVSGPEVSGSEYGASHTAWIGRAYELAAT